MFGLESLELTTSSLPTMTTKVRPVFNSILLNKSAYPGVTLMGDILKQFIRFSTYKYVLVADIRKAFFIIHLASEKNRNRFCLFLKKGDNLRCYRYSTIIFDFNASSFILNYKLKYPSDKFPLDEWSHVLNSNFYVDNLVKTRNSITLSTLYTLAKERPQNGNFDIQSCNSSCADLWERIEADETLLDFDSGLEKVLGYRYSPAQDSSKASKNIDALSLCLPVTVESQIQIERGKQKLD